MIRFDIPYVDTDRTLTQAGYEVFRGQERRIDAAEGQIYGAQTSAIAFRVSNLFIKVFLPRP